MLAAAAAGAVDVDVVGPFRISFYGSGEGDGTYTGGQGWTTEQRTDVAASIQTWDGMLANSAGRDIELHMFWVEFGANSTLGGSYSPTYGDGATSWTYPEHIWRDGVNYNGPWDGFDSVIQYDITAAGLAWNFGADAPGGSEIDFRSVVTHELGHSIGFYPTYDSTPRYDDWGNCYGTAASPTAHAGYQGLSMWDQNLVDADGNRPVSGGKGTPANFDQTEDPAYWDGTFAVDEYGALVPIYAPKPYEPGSSLSHLDEATFPDALMSPFVSTGQALREPIAVEWAMMRDMGWDVIPEPGAGVLCTLAFFLTVLRRPRPGFVA